MKCIIVDDNKISLAATTKLVSKVSYLELMDSFTNPVEALSFVSENKADLIFLDIEMPEINGIEFLKALSQPQPIIIMTTSSKDHAIQAFDYNVTDYLVKPIVISRFIKAVAKAKDIFVEQNMEYINEKTVFVKTGSSIVNVNKSEILWIEGCGDYVLLNTEKEKFIVHSTMHAIEEKFSKKEYMRVHRSFIVRLDKITNIEDNTISFLDKLIPIGKTYLKDVFSRLNML